MTTTSIPMCGRAKLPDAVSEIKLDLKIDFDEIGKYRPRWNAAPTSQLPIVISQEGARTLTLMRWGLIPAWAKNLKIGASTFNARAEDIETRAAFRGAWRAHRRCLVIANGYYEWCSGDKEPFAVTLANRAPMTFAGLWDLWRAPAEPNGKLLKSFAIITTQANDLLRPLHGRMPVVLAPQSWAAWLGETRATARELKAMLQPDSVRAMRFGRSIERLATRVTTAPISSRRCGNEPLGTVAPRSRSQARKKAKTEPKPWQLRRMPPTYIV